jgi:formylglycine-generating enzyme required for sulfatase activity
MGEALRTECDTCNAAYDETPRHKIWISKPFYISKYEVTQRQWLEVMEANPSYFIGDQRPVDKVSWTNAQLFIYALNVHEKTTAYRLPTEAEWEYAARSGSVQGRLLL